MEQNVIDEHEVTNRETVYEGYVNVEKITVTKGDKSIDREVLKTGNGTSALIYDTVKGKYIFVEQFRGGAEGVMVEIVAGSIDEGETPEQAAKREIMEETGYKVDTMTHIKDFYSSPGRTDEIMSIFYAEVSEQVNEGGGIGDEDISIVEVEQIGMGGRLFFQDPMNMEMTAGVEQTMLPPYQLIDAKSLIAVMWREYNSTLKDMADVITQAKIRTL
jgi:ADP-ribose pyrophosphatase